MSTAMSNQQTVSNTLSNSLSTRSAVIESAFLVYKIGNQRQIFAQLFVLLIPSLLQALSQILQLFIVANMLKTTMYEYCRVYIIGSALSEFLPIAWIKGASKNISAYLDRSQMKAVRVISTYSLLIVWILLLTGAFVALVQFQNLFFTRVYIPQLFQLIGFCQLISQGHYRILDQLCLAEQSIMLRTCSIFVQILIFLVCSYYYQFMQVVKTEEGIEGSEAVTLMLFYILSYTPSVIAMCMFLNRKFNQKVRFVRACVFDSHYFRPFRVTAFWRILKSSFFYILHDNLFLVVVFIGFSASKEISVINPAQGNMLILQLVLFVYYGKFCEAFSEAATQLATVTFRVNIDTRTARLTPQLCIYIVCVGIVSTILFFLCIKPLNKQIFGFLNPDFLPDLEICQWVVLRILFTPLLKMCNAYGVVKANWKLILFSNLVEGFAFIASLICLFVAKNTEHSYALIVFMIIENIGGLFSIFLIIRATKKRVGQKQNFNFMSQMQNMDMQGDNDIFDMNLDQIGELTFGQQNDEGDEVNEDDSSTKTDDVEVQDVIFGSKPKEEGEANQVTSGPQDGTTALESTTNFFVAATDQYSSDQQISNAVMLENLGRQDTSKGDSSKTADADINLGQTDLL